MILKYVDEDYSDGIIFDGRNNVVKRVLGYITNVHKTLGMYTGCVGIPDNDIDIMEESFYAVQILYGKLEGDKLVHMVISFPVNTDLSDEQIMFAGEAVAAYIGERFQVVFGVHLDEDSRHIHFVINPVSFVNGEVYKPNTTKLGKYYNMICDMLRGHRLGDFVYELPERYR